MPINKTKPQPVNTRRYVAIGKALREQLSQDKYKVGDRLPTEREIAEVHNVSRTVIREAIIMLEIEGLVEVRKGSGVYVTNLPKSENLPINKTDTELQSNLLISAFSGLSVTDIGPFELLQARQLIESNIAEFAAHQITKSEIEAMKAVLEKEKNALNMGDNNEQYDYEFHILIAQAAKNDLLVEVVKLMWRMRLESKMWEQLHAHIDTKDYQKKWLNDHQTILSALQRKDALGAKKAMWQHLENVKKTLLELSDIDHENFDGYLFSSYPLADK
ncbi:GntR family transcriptional regulator [Psychromonas marina]|uniref:GntR family transcriptional regulator n=1 Tax=Psychromonas marina TaxID=88364 RepID=A0ABQ6DZ97_9GAMM|nr:FCD domain-containing protein [Psychromonas marina]GLS90486.1 GntR family transcriptional regulator [Psychromonas marina]